MPDDGVQPFAGLLRERRPFLAATARPRRANPGQPHAPVGRDVNRVAVDDTADRHDLGAVRLRHGSGGSGRHGQDAQNLHSATLLQRVRGNVDLPVQTQVRAQPRTLHTPGWRHTVAKKKTGTRTTGRRKTAPRKTGRRKPQSASRKPAARSRRAAPAGRARSAQRPSAAAKAAANVRGALKGAVAAVTTRLPGAAIDAITLLERDHRRLEDLLKRGEETGDRARQERRQLLDTIAAELTLHETIEERVLYPALKAHPQTRDIVLEGFQEHHVADLILHELYETAVDDERWAAKFKVFKENLEHHIEEEEGPMFRAARGVMSREVLIDLGARMQRMKDDPAKL